MREKVLILGLSNSGIAAAECAAFLQQLRPGGAVDGAVHAPAPEQALVGSVHNGVCLHDGDVVSNDVQGHSGHLPVEMRSEFHTVLFIDKD